MRTLFLLFTLWSTILLAQKAPTKIPFTITPQGHLVIEATIEGQKGQFIFDTGAGITLLTKKFADQVANLEKTNRFYVGHRSTGEALSADLWYAPNLHIGTYKIQNQLISVYDIEFPLDGLISLTHFKGKSLTIDFKNQVLVVEHSASLQQRVEQADYTLPLVVSQNRGATLEIATHLQLNQKINLLANLDTGAGFNVFRFSARYKELLNIAPDSITETYKASYFAPDKGNIYYSTTLEQLATAQQQIQLTNSKVTFIEGLIYEGIVSLNWLGEAVTIDLANERLLVQKKID